MDGLDIPCLASVFILNVPFWGISFVENKLFRFASVFAKYEFKLKKKMLYFPTWITCYGERRRTLDEFHFVRSVSGNQLEETLQ